MSIRDEGTSDVGNQTLSLIALTCGTLAVVAGASVLVGWWFGIKAMRTPIPGTPAMMPNTALMFLLSGTTVLLRACGLSGVLARWAASVAAGFSLAVAAATLLEYIASVDLGIDRMLSSAATAPPAPHTAGGHLLIATALLISTRSTRLCSALVEGAALLTAAVAMLVLLGYPLGVIYFATPFSLPSSIGMAVHTACSLLVLVVGVLALRPDAALTRLLISDYSGGAAARRLLPVALVVIPLAAFVAVELEHHGAWPKSGTVAVVAAASQVAVLVAVRSVGRRLDRTDAARVFAERRAAELLERETMQRARLESVLAQMPEAVIVLDADGHVALRSGPMEELLATARPEVPVYDVRLPSGRSLAVDELPGMRALAKGETILGEELEVVTRTGARVPVLASARPILAAGEVVGSVAMFRDIRSLKELERLREEWTSMIAHDLRQPANVIALNVELLERASLAERERNRVRRIREAIDHLQRMTEDLLDASAIEARRLALRPERLDLDDLLAKASEAVPRASERMRFEVTAGLLVVGDRLRLLQVLANLLSNAVKYGDPDSEIALRVHAQPDAHACRIAVENRGSGISAEDLPRLFDRFARTEDACNSSVPGLGLGLYVCRNLVEAMGGQIWATSEPGGVTTFTFTVPLADAVPESAATGHGHQHERERARVSAA